MSNSFTAPVRILVLGNGSLLDECVCNLLVTHSGLNVTRILYTDENTLYDLVNNEYPCTVFINEFGALDVGRIIKLIFSAPSAFVRCIIVVHVENSRLDVYCRPEAHAPVTRRESILVHTKEELVNLALEGSICA